MVGLYVEERDREAGSRERATNPRWTGKNCKQARRAHQTALSPPEGPSTTSATASLDSNATKPEMNKGAQRRHLWQEGKQKKVQPQHKHQRRQILRFRRIPDPRRLRRLPLQPHLRNRILRWRQEMLRQRRSPQETQPPQKRRKILRFFRIPETEGVPGGAGMPRKKKVSSPERRRTGTPTTTPPRARKTKTKTKRSLPPMRRSTAMSK